MFTTGRQSNWTRKTNNGGKDDLGNLEYCREMIVECGLTPDDMFVPKPDGQKAIQRKPLPECVY